MSLFIIISIIFIIFCFVYKVKIKFRTFFHRGFLPVRGKFGVYCYCGKQGKGKTYSVVEYLIDNKNKSVIFSNIANVSNVDYFYFTGFEELIYIKQIIDFKPKDDHNLMCYIKSKFPDEERANKLFEFIKIVYSQKKQIVIVYDEIFTELQKKSPLTKDILDFLCQMRKRKIIFLTTAQEWAEIPLTFRRFCRYEIDCNMLNLLVFGVLIKNFKDAENMKWSDLDQEFVAPLVSNTITKTRKYVANSYDTFLRISSVQEASPHQ